MNFFRSIKPIGSMEKFSDLMEINRAIDSKKLFLLLLVGFMVLIVFWAVCFLRETERFSPKLVSSLAKVVINLIEATGYYGVFVLMVMESCLLPVPSEIVMPFAGYLVYVGGLDFLRVVVAGALGNIAGSIISYCIGFLKGRSFLVKYGKYFLVTREHIEMADKWFERYGEKAVFIGRLLPVVRTVISLPAGITKMNQERFLIWTTIGVFPWCALLAYLGMILGANWYIIEETARQFSLAIFLISFLVLILYLKRIKGRGLGK